MNDDHSFRAGAYSHGSAFDLKKNALVGAYDPKRRPRPARSYADVDRAYEYFNRELFGGLLPPCLPTFQRSGRGYGYYSPDRLTNIRDPTEVVDEIALNPIHFGTRLTAKVLSTLVHEMAHLWQHHFGKPSRGGYHNKEWAIKMVGIGLIPSSTGLPGGKPTGECVSHYIKPGGRFDIACSAFLTTNSVVLFQDRAHHVLQNFDPLGTDGSRSGSGLEKIDREHRRKVASKTRFTCGRCGQHAWAKPTAMLTCSRCEEGMQPITVGSVHR